MRIAPDAQEDRAAGVTVAVPRVRSVEVLPDYALRVRFDDGVSGVVECRRMIWGDRAGVFANLRDAASFAAAFVDHGAVTWPGELDLALDAMHDAIAGTGRWVLS